jgi:hypothetical protein
MVCGSPVRSPHIRACCAQSSQSDASRGTNVPRSPKRLRDAYTAEFLGLPQPHVEADLHRAFLDKLKEFLIERGRDFCFAGSEYPLQVGPRDFALDLLFWVGFHRYKLVGIRHLILASDMDDRPEGVGLDDLKHKRYTVHRLPLTRVPSAVASSAPLPARSAKLLTRSRIKRKFLHQSDRAFGHRFPANFTAQHLQTCPTAAELPACAASAKYS